MSLYHEMIERARAGCRESIDRLVDRMRPLACRIVLKHFNGLDDDAMQEATLAILTAIRTYRFDKETSFVAYCHNVIFRELVANDDSLLRKETEYRDKNQSMSGVDLSYTHDYDQKIFCDHLIGKLDKRAGDIVRRRFGIQCPEESVSNIAANTGYTPRRIQQILKESLEKLAMLSPDDR